MRDLLKKSSHLLLRRQNNILSAAFIIMVAYGLSNLLGLFKTRLLISYFFGSKASLLDVYYAAFVIPDTIFQLLVIGSLSAAFIPVFTRLLTRNEKMAWTMASSSLNMILLVLGILSLAIFIVATPVSQLIAPGFTPSQIAIMAGLLRVMLMAQMFFAVSGFLTGMIQSHQSFLVPALAPLVYNLGIILGIVLLSPTMGIMGPAIGVVLGAALHMGIQIPVAYHLGFRFTAKLDFQDPNVREVVRLMPPRALALGIDQIEQFVSVILSSLLAPGSLSLLNVARLLYTIPASLFGVTIGQAAFPLLSRQSSDPDKQVFHSTLTSTLAQISFMALPVSTLFIVLRIPIVRIVFGASSFPWSATIVTAQTLAVLAVSAVFSAAMQLIIRGFYALHNTRTPLLVGLAAAVFDTLFGILVVQVLRWGILGLAFAISLTACLETVVLFIFLSNMIGLSRAKYLPLIKSIAKMILISAAMGISLWIPMRLLDQSVFDTTRSMPLVALTAITSLIGMAVYMALSYIFGVSELESFISVFKRISHWREFLKPSVVATEPLLDSTSEQS